MTTVRRLLWLSLAVLALGMDRPSRPYPPPPAVVAPLLYVKLIGPPGSHVTYFHGNGPARTVHEPTPVGLRPGYCYRPLLGNLPGMPEGVGLAPSIEVLGTLLLPNDLPPNRYPVPIVLTAEDVARARAGGMVTKVIYLECEGAAEPVATTPDEPIEFTAITEAAAVAEAKLRGRLLMVVRLGGRETTPAEVNATAIPGTVQLPGAGVLPPPAAPPSIPVACFMPFDPLYGPKFPCCEAIHDGGDRGANLGHGPDGTLSGLDPADTAIEFTDPSGRRRVCASNPACVIVPRFVSVRVELQPIGLDIAVPIDSHLQVSGRAEAVLRLPPLMVAKIDNPIEVGGRDGPSETTNTTGLGVLSRAAGPVLIAKVEGILQAVGVTEPDELTWHPKCPLMLTKTADPKYAQVGDVVTFTLKYANVGSGTINEVAVSDSLTGRLEYIAGSNRSDRPAAFTIRGNDAGSAVLRWEIAGKLLPGQTGTVSFQARIR